MVFDITKIGEIRKRIGLTQKQFANKSGVSQSMIAKIEAGRMDPSWSSVQKIEAFVSSFEKEKELDAKEIMVRKIISVDKRMAARKVIELMNKHTISQVPVLEGDNVLGIITESSILNKDLSDMEHLSAWDLMIEPPPILSESAKISVVAYLLKSYPLVLIKKGGLLKGLITKADLLKVLSDY
ncbi:CBS domain-containing protein [archaeon]|nr:CBS domain-containing protein [Nanoarchaeota archaeon]MCG2723277.1 CBS domain-containing protein [archaeon]